MRLCATKIQAVWRGYMARKKAAELRRKKREYEEFLRLMSTKIQKTFRGHMGRRRFRTIWNLARIQNAHPMVLSQALRRNKFGNKVFWYTKRAELRLLYTDYYELVDRLGKLPPLHLVEMNIEEIKDRVHTIECEYATMIQKIFRGLVGRRFIVQYRYAVCRLLEVRMNAALLIQRIYRSWRDTKRLRNIRRNKLRLTEENKYKKEMKEKLLNNKLADMDDRSMAFYKRSWHETKAAVFTGKVAYGEEKGYIYKALRNSSYYTKGIPTNNEAIFKENIKFKNDVKKDISLNETKLETRSKYVIQRRKCSRAMSIYLKDEFEERRKVFHKRIFEDGDKVCHFVKTQNIRKARAHGLKVKKMFDNGEDILANLLSMQLKKNNIIGPL